MKLFRAQVQADLDAVMRWKRQLTVSFLFQLDPEGSQKHKLQRREAPGQSPASGPQVLVSRPGNEVWAPALSTCLSSHRAEFQVQASPFFPEMSRGGVFQAAL